MTHPNQLRRLGKVALLLSLSACGGGAPPPAHPPKIEPVRPTVEKTPPPAPAKP
ncbi:MAG TPA: hypothetical protein VEQ58_23755 [Polyangiaceae bacterium]|nr:hypothetical protein [Polyangiaceae bacterium]